MRVLDLFSGIGGFSLGLRMAGGFETVQFCEIDPYCQKVLAKNFPGVPIHDDIRSFRPAPGSADLICGGFPCQDISSIGKNAGIDGERSGLWRELHRVISNVRPRYCIVENVAALLSRGLGRVLGDLAEIRYDAEWHCIPASHIGAPHRRDRVWIVAYPAIQGLERCDERPKSRLLPLYQLSPLHAKADFPHQLSASAIHGSGHGIPHRVDRLRGLGNAVVPQVVAEIGKAIMAAARNEQGTGE